MQTYCLYCVQSYFNGQPAGLSLLKFRFLSPETGIGRKNERKTPFLFKSWLKNGFPAHIIKAPEAVEGPGSAVKQGCFSFLIRTPTLHQRAGADQPFGATLFISYIVSPFRRLAALLPPGTTQGETTL